MIQIQLDEQVASALVKQAESRGLSLSEYLKLMAAVPSPQAQAISADELDRLIDEEASDDANVTGTFSRADIYADHD
jgi:hypothetical protein